MLGSVLDLVNMRLVSDLEGVETTDGGRTLVKRLDKSFGDKVVDCVLDLFERDDDGDGDDEESRASSRDRLLDGLIAAFDT